MAPMARKKLHDKDGPENQLGPQLDLFDIAYGVLSTWYSGESPKMWLRLPS